MIGCALDIVTVHDSDTGCGVHPGGVDVQQREDGGQDLPEKGDKAWVLFPGKNWGKDNGCDQMCDRIEQFSS